MARKLTTPIMRMVQGSMQMRQARDDDNNPKFDDDGKPVMVWFFAGAIAKDNPEWGPFWGEMYTEARTSFPHLCNAAGEITHPKFSWKYQDGDGVDKNGKSVADKPGFAGHHIIKFSTQIEPKCFPANDLSTMAQLQDPHKIIKPGHYIRVRVFCNGNGVDTSKGSRVPGLYMNPEIILHEGYGPEIITGEDPKEAFAQAAAYRPAGMSAAPVGAAPGAAPSALSGAPAPAPHAAPAPVGIAAAPAPLPASAPAPAGVAPSPPASVGGAAPPPAPAADPNMYTDPATGLRYIHTGTAGAFTVKQLIDVGWTVQTLLGAGHARQA